MPDDTLPPQLSIIIPVLNEAPSLKELFGILSAQRDLSSEIIFSDGGSTDDTVATIYALSHNLRSRVLVVTGPPGRGRQMNRGAEAARGRIFLFLHADSCFDSPLAIRRGLDALQEAMAKSGTDAWSGRFRLHFRRRDQSPSFGYFFYSAKARLNRPECIHGDQGFLIGREFFLSVRVFDESLPINEDTSLAEEIRRRGTWLLLPDRVYTSARRFEAEGLRKRQTLNAIIMNCLALRQEEILTRLPPLYRSQDHCRPLDLAPFFAEIHHHLAGLPPTIRYRFWYLTGTYVRNNTWQLAFAVDVLRAYRKRLDVDAVATPVLQAYDRYLDLLIDHPIGRLLAAALTWCWFRLNLLRFYLKKQL